MDIDDILRSAEARMIRCVADYDADLKSIRSGQASTEMVEHVHVDIAEYGGVVPLKSVALTTKADTRMLIVKPFDPKTITEIVRSINVANLGLTPQIDGKIIRLEFQPLSKENRKKQIKVIRDRLEQHKVTIRNIRHGVLKHLKELKELKGASSVSEETQKKAGHDVVQMAKSYEAELKRIVILACGTAKPYFTTDTPSLKRIMYIEFKGESLTGPGRIGWVEMTRSRRSYLYNGKMLQKVRGYKYNCVDVETGELYWVSGPKKRGGDTMYGGIVEIDDDAREEYWVDIRKLPACKHLTRYRG